MADVSYNSVATPGGNLPYVGNADYRGYLNYLATSGGDSNAQSLIGSNGGLGYVNNQGQVTGTTDPNLINENKNAYSQYQNLTGTATAATSTAGSGNASGLSNTGNSQMLDAITQGAQNNLNNLYGQQDTAVANYGVDTSNAAKYYSDESKQAADTTQGNVNYYGQQNANTAASQQLSLAQLADQIRSGNQSFQNSLGNMGAGSSSAVQMGEYAFGRQKAMAQSAINLNAAEQTALINKQIDSAIMQGQDAQQIVSDQKTQGLQTIKEKLQTDLANIDNAISTATTQQARDILFYTRKDLVGTALDQLSNLDQTITNSKQYLTNALSQGTTNANSYAMTASPTQPQAAEQLPTPNFNPGAGLSNIFNQ